MFGILIYDILFFTIPVVLLTFWGISIYRYVSARKKNSKDPETFSPSEMKTRKTILMIASVLAGAFLIIVIGFIILLFSAIAFM